MNPLVKRLLCYIAIGCSVLFAIGVIKVIYEWLFLGRDSLSGHFFQGFIGAILLFRLGKWGLMEIEEEKKRRFLNRYSRQKSVEA